MNSAGSHIPASKTLGGGGCGCLGQGFRLKKGGNHSLGTPPYPSKARQNLSMSPCPTLLLDRGCMSGEPFNTLHERDAEGRDDFALQLHLSSAQRQH